jgi:hypothetical protein
MNNYKQTVYMIYFLLLSGFAGHFAHLVASEKVTCVKYKYNFHFFRIVAFMNWIIGTLALITSQIKPDIITNILPDGGNSIFLSSLLMTFPLNGFYFYFKRKRTEL